MKNNTFMNMSNWGNRVKIKVNRLVFSMSPEKTMSKHKRCSLQKDRGINQLYPKLFDLRHKNAEAQPTERNFLY